MSQYDYFFQCTDHPGCPIVTLTLLARTDQGLPEFHEEPEGWSCSATRQKLKTKESCGRTERQQSPWLIWVSWLRKSRRQSWQCWKEMLTSRRLRSSVYSEFLDPFALCSNCSGFCSGLLKLIPCLYVWPITDHFCIENVKNTFVLNLIELFVLYIFLLPVSPSYKWLHIHVCILELRNECSE